MRNWFLGQGIPMYAEAILLAAGLFTLWMTGRIYKRLIREADQLLQNWYAPGGYTGIDRTLHKKIPRRPFFASELEPVALSDNDGDACCRRR